MAQRRRMSKRACKHTGNGMCQQQVTRSKDRAPIGAISPKSL